MGRDMNMARVYAGFSVLDRETAVVMAQGIGLGVLAQRYSEQVAAHASSLAIEKRAADVPGGAPQSRPGHGLQVRTRAIRDASSARYLKKMTVTCWPITARWLVLTWSTNGSSRAPQPGSPSSTTSTASRQTTHGPRARSSEKHLSASSCGRFHWTRTAQWYFQVARSYGW